MLYISAISVPTYQVFVDITGNPGREANSCWCRQVGDALRYEGDMESSTRRSNEVNYVDRLAVSKVFHVKNISALTRNLLHGQI